MRNRIWSLKVTNAVTSYALDTSAPGSPLRFARETTIVVENGNGRAQGLPVTTHSSLKISRSIAPIDWLVIAIGCSSAALFFP